MFVNMHAGQTALSLMQYCSPRSLHHPASLPARGPAAHTARCSNFACLGHQPDSRHHAYRWRPDSRLQATSDTKEAASEQAKDLEQGGGEDSDTNANSAGANGADTHNGERQPDSEDEPGRRSLSPKEEANARKLQELLTKLDKHGDAGPSGGPPLPPLLDRAVAAFSG